MSEALRDTLGDIDWLKTNEAEVRVLFPETWTYIGNINWLYIRFALRALGIRFSDDGELDKILQYLSRIGMVESRRMKCVVPASTGQLRRSPRPLFPCTRIPGEPEPVQ